VPVPDRLELPTGAITQRPPAYSAVRIGGRRAYERARAGEAVTVPEREVTLYRFEELAREGDRAELLVECSAGTYVRSLVTELGGYCEELRRTRIGPFDVADADPARVLPLADALGFLPTVRLDPDAARRAGFGQVVAGGGDPPAGEVLLIDDDGPVAIAEPRDGRLKPVVGFRG
jgi:tRNA pseudouridine55 synthase